ncbi:LPS assembly lipoprotein LptE [Candidatus Methylocalor cossyra]|uniref:LPS-assembly lipoprotein LptE n=1 Tax=Candidatus Methylocalor cossyra TaxID=3108543 RepID=A0ABM9NLF6_9GAMM
MFRRPVARIAAGLMALALAGCGFHLRGSLPGPAETKTLYLTGISRQSSLYANLAQVLSYSGGTLALQPAQAGAIIHVTEASHTRRPITLSRQGQANTFDLTFRLRYEVQTPKGEVLIPPQEMEVRRDYFNNQVSPLGQGEEEAMLRLEMEKEAAETLLRRVVYTLNHRQASAPPRT